jgi:hypothetical protein
MAVLRSLKKVRLLTGAQIARLHMANGSNATRARRTRAMLQRLSDLKVVVRLGRRIGGVRAGSAGFLYGLSGWGQAVLAQESRGRTRRRVWETSLPHQRHLLAVAELYVALVEADQAESVELLGFEAEPTCWRRFSGLGGAAVTLKPDAFVRLGVGAYERSGFIEVDMGTESGSTIARKCGVYLAYWNSGLEQQRHGIFPMVLWLADAAKRVEQIAAVIRRLPGEAHALFHVGLLSEAVGTLSAEPGGAA